MNPNEGFKKIIFDNSIAVLRSKMKPTMMYLHDFTRDQVLQNARYHLNHPGAFQRCQCDRDSGQQEIPCGNTLQDKGILEETRCTSEGLYQCVYGCTPILYSCDEVQQLYFLPEDYCTWAAQECSSMVVVNGECIREYRLGAKNPKPIPLAYPKNSILIKVC